MLCLPYINPLLDPIWIMLLLYMMYDQPNNDSFKNKLEKIQYNTALAITGAI